MYIQTTPLCMVVVMVEGWLHVVGQHGWVKGKGTDLVIHHPCGWREGVKGLK